MLKRLKNLWAWSEISPYEAGQDAAKGVAEVIQEYFSPHKGEIVYPDKVKEVLAANPEASLDELITR